MKRAPLSPYELVRVTEPTPGTDEPLDEGDYQLIEMEEIPGRERLLP